VQQLEAETARLVTEREILRRAAKYFAGETGWLAASSSLPTSGVPMCFK
jgi:hypothetical protein